METMKCYTFLFFATVFFFGLIVFVGEITGNSLLSVLPSFSWDMVNTWDEIWKLK
ncbi:hypothetical protein ACWE42_12290 [Sutcliffiella cohnii]|uniref:hypothetical protein n=1 Tax=Sutcliffiella TaxID=2837511 RepID=UPI000AD1CBF4|nr:MULTISPECIES: hypothetical protein [Sutcliffiella]MED4018020.1 hypothetical protein [Sutcliffiella cohnii]WBL16484.1 hypothetical protein O1A01_07585 [Sutcliffiella sp. NC1]